MQESAPMRAPHVLLVDFLHGGISEGRGLLYCDKSSGVAPNKLMPYL